nr:uncharacterized mitochondrial protein AtMg00810-like [Tanacetum cinerariifolium]
MVIDMACEEYSQEVLRFFDVIVSGNPTPYYDLIASTSSSTITPFRDSDFLLEEVDALLALEDDPTSREVDHSYYDPEGKLFFLKHFLMMIHHYPLPIKECICLKFEKNLKFMKLKTGDDKLPVIIAKDLSVEEKAALIKVLKSHKQAIAWKLSDIKVLWIRTQLTDYGFFYDKVPIYCDSKSAIAISCNPVQHTRTKHIDVRGKVIVNSPLPIYDQEPSMVAEDDEMSKDKEIDKLMALISLSFKKIYKPTNNNLQTSSNTSRANQDNSPRINKGTGYDNQRIVNVAGARETVGTTVVQKSKIQYYYFKEYGHVARECQKPKRANDAAYHKEKMLLCKQEEAGFQLNVE